MQIAANGGVLEEAPENTMYAFELAVEQGASILKVEVRGTKDGELVIMRDATIDRTTNGKGFVSGLFFDEVAVYDAGSWLGEEFEGETVPLLREVLRFAKINDLEVILDVREQGIESDILAMVQSLDMMRKVYFWGILSNLREAEPSLGGPELVFLSPEELTPANINRVHSQYKNVITSLLNTDDRGKMREIMMKGPDIILVDFPAVASDILNQKGWRRAIRRIQKRRPLVTVPFSGRVVDMDKMDEFMEKDEGGRMGAIDLLDPVGSLYHLLLGDGGETDMKDLKKSSRRASLRRELRSLNRELHEPGEGDKGFFGRVVGKVRMGMSADEADDSRIAALEMTELPPFTVVPYLVKALDSKRPEIRANAAWALGLVGDYTVMPELIRLLEDDEDLNVRREVEISLGRLRQTEAVRFLRRRIVYDGVPPVRFDAARSIGEIGDPSAIGDLTRAMHGDVVNNARSNDVNVVKLRGGDVDWRVRGACAEALGRIGDPSAAAKLGEFLMENSSAQHSMWARSRAAWALSSIGEDSLGVLLTALRDDERFVRRESAWALIRIGQPAIPALLRALRDPDARVRERAALALGWIGDSKAMQPLVRSLYDEDIKVREAVVWAIGHIGGSQAQEVLKGLVNDNEDERIKEMAGEAIARQSRRVK